MNQEEKKALRYRFKGYQLPKIQLDETGPTYYILDPHPYFYNQPLYWQKAVYRGNQLPASELIEPQFAIEKNANTSSPGIVKGRRYSILSPMLPLT